MRKAGIVTTRIRQKSRCMTSDNPRLKGRSSEAGLGQREGAGQGGSSRSQVAGPGKSVSIRSVVKDLMAETLSVHRGEGSDGRNPSQSVVVRDLMAENPLQSVVVRDQMAENPLSSWLLDPLSSSFFSCLRDIPGCLSKSHVRTS